MKVPFSWLKEYVDIDVTAQELDKKIKFIIIVGMQVYFGQIVVIIIVKFEIS